MVCSLLFAEEIITFNTIIEREKHKLEQIWICSPVTIDSNYVNIDLRHQYGFSVV